MSIELKLKKALVKTMLDNGESLEDIIQTTGISKIKITEFLNALGYLSIGMTAKLLGTTKSNFKRFYQIRESEIMQACPKCSSFSELLQKDYLNADNFDDLRRIYLGKSRKRSCPNGEYTISEVAKMLGMTSKSGYGQPSRLESFYKNNEHKFTGCPTYNSLKKTRCLSRKCAKSLKGAYSLPKKSSEDYLTPYKFAKEAGLVWGKNKYGQTSTLKHYFDKYGKELKSLNDKCPTIEELKKNGLIHKDCLQTFKDFIKLKRKPRKKNPVKKINLLPIAALSISGIILYLIYRSRRGV